MLSKLLQDAVVFGTVCPMYGDLFFAAMQGRHSVNMGPLQPSMLNELKERYESLGFTCETRFDLEKGAHMLKVTFAKSLEEINKAVAEDNETQMKIESEGVGLEDLE